MKKVKKIFPSRNYITIDSFGDVEVIFNPVGDGFEGDDKFLFRKGRWAFRVNDFLSGRVLPDGSKEGMGRKIYSLNIVYNEEDGEPVVNTTYVDPTSVIPLDGSIVDVVGSEKLAQEETLKAISDGVAKETTLQTVAKETTLNSMSDKIDVLENSIGGVKTAVEDVKSNIDNFFDDDTGYAMRSQITSILEGISGLKKLVSDAFISEDEYIVDIVNDLFFAYSNRFLARGVRTQNIGGNLRYSLGTVFYFGATHFIALRTDCISISVGGEILLLGDMSEYNNGTVKRLDGVKFAQSDVTKILS